MVSRWKIFLVASIAALVLLGTATASATKLCTGKACGIVYSAGTTVNLSLKSGTTTRLTSGGSTIATCTGSSISSNTENESGATISANIESLTWSGCGQTTDTLKNGSLSIEWISGTSNGTVRASNSEVTVQIFGVSCTFGAGESTDLGTLTGGEEPLLQISATVKKTAGGFLCPSTAGWDAEYVVTEPHSLVVAEEGAGITPSEWEWHLEGLQLWVQAESETIKGAGGAFTLATTIGETKVSISCESAELTNATITPGGKGASTVKLSKGCQVVGQPTCVVAEPINLKANTDPLTSSTTSQLFNRYMPAESKFATVGISVCGFAGEYAVEGSFAGEFKAGEERVEEPVIFSPKLEEEAGTNLKFGGKAATLEGEFAIAAQGGLGGQKIAPGTVIARPLPPLFPKGVKANTSETKTITYEVLGKKGSPGIKYGNLSVVGSAGVLSLEKEDCSGNTKKPTETCTITIKVAPKNAIRYAAEVIGPLESADGLRTGFANYSLDEKGT